MLERCVGEKTRWPPSLAAVKHLATRFDRGSERPSCIVRNICSWRCYGMRFEQG